jgi:hypothetical protein
MLRSADAVVQGIRTAPGVERKEQLSTLKAYSILLRTDGEL